MIVPVLCYPAPKSLLLSNILNRTKIRYMSIRGDAMDKTGVASLIGGIILLALGAYGVWVFVPEVIMVIKGLIGIIAIIIGIFLVIFGAILIKD
jgi:hypothetical protein